MDLAARFDCARKTDLWSRAQFNEIPQPLGVDVWRVQTWTEALPSHFSKEFLGRPPRADGRTPLIDTYFITAFRGDIWRGLPVPRMTVRPGTFL